MPSPVSEADEFGLMDSLFDDLDAELLQSIDKPASVTSVKKPTVSARLTAVPHPAPSKRNPLQPVSSNGRSQLSQDRSLDLKGKGRAIDVPAVSTSKPKTQPFRPTAHAPPVAKTSPYFQKAGSSFKPSTSTPNAALKARELPVSKADADLLHDLNWSEEEEEFKTKPATAKQTLIKQSTSARINPLASKASKPTASAAEQSSRAKAEQLANLRKQPGYVPVSQRYTRCTVLSVTEKVINQFRREKSAIVEIAACKSLRAIKLFDEWATTELEEGDTINVIGDFVEPSEIGPSAPAGPSTEELPTCTLSYSSPNLLILHPDTLLSATRVSDASQCRRKAVVQEKLRSAGALTPALVYGNLLHELLQACLLAMSTYKLPEDADEEDEKEAIDRCFGPNKRSQEIKKLLSISKNVEQLFMLGIELDEARTHMAQKSIGYADFAERFIGNKVKPEAFLSDPRNKDIDPATASRLAIAGVHDIEEDIWSPRLGLKGKVDASVQGILRGPQSVIWPLGKEDAGVLPFEIKTGRSVGMLQHRAQTMLYTQMMADRYDREIEAGLLYYTQTNSIIRVEPARNELRGLAIARNEMARYLTHQKPDFVSKGDDDEISMPPPPSARRATLSETEMEEDRPVGPEFEPAGDEDADLWADAGDLDVKDFASQRQAPRSVLPPAIDELRSCKNCYAAEGCMLYRRAVDKVASLLDENGKGDEALQEAYDERTGHLTDDQCDFFEKWERLITLEEREMVRFKKEIWTLTAHERQKHGRCLADMVIDPSFAGNGLQPESDKPGVHRYRYRMIRSSNPEGLSSSNAFGSAPPATCSTSSQPLTAGQLSIGDPVVLSIEPSVLALARGYVLDIHADYIDLGLDHSITTLPGDACDGFAPTSGRLPSEVVHRIDKDELQAGMGKIRENLAQLFYAKGDEKRRNLIVDLAKPRFRAVEQSDNEAVSDGALNADQLEAVSKVLSAQDYALILGMPGTGKTTTVAEIIKALVAQGKSILLTSYTHSAVDNILAKIQDLDVKMLRLGNPDKVMPSLAHLTLAGLPPPASMAELEDRYFSPQIVATTALSVDHPLFSRRTFDYCIVDEASQITLPTCLGPLRYAETFVLVGDHNQLPPLVKSPTARLDGLEVSLFRRLSEAHPSALVYLTHQYRMNEDIMALSNSLIYNGKLKCGSPTVAGQGLTLSTSPKTKSMPGWIQDLLDPNRKVIFVDTDSLPARESKSGRLVQNEVEADLLTMVTEALLSCGVGEEQVALITLYKQQIKLLSARLRHREAVEILTADKSQGRDKDCILMSLVRSNTEKKVGDLLKDWRRLNVCFTRAKKKLIIFGSKSTLSAIPLLSQFFELVESRGWLYSLQPDALSVSASPRQLPTSASKRKEFSNVDMVRTTKKGKLGLSTSSPDSRGLLATRPILRDIAASQ